MTDNAARSGGRAAQAGRSDIEYVFCAGWMNDVREAYSTLDEAVQHWRSGKLRKRVGDEIRALSPEEMQLANKLYWQHRRRKPRSLPHPLDAPVEGK